MSVGLYQSENYIWNIQTDRLGEGSFGKVYCAINKQTGERVAVKTFNNVHHQVSQETRMLQSLKHQYIIQLLAVEAEKLSGNFVIVMEHCNGGSLMQYLNEPENVYGLKDEEFLLVVDHLSSGLEYLKKHNVIHRDVKPDNILRHILDDGRTIYKLTDFGTARELPEGENFTSLHGTEPYLHPQLYKVCFFREADFNRQFGPDTDLWSIGVTLYHIATGQLPFRVYNRPAMLSIFNEMTKTEGIISGVQMIDSESVIFSQNLPQTSRLSGGLKMLITPIIAGLFIHDDYLTKWTFIRYYEEIKNLLSRRGIKVFYLNKMQMLQVYVNPDKSFYDFQCRVYEQAGVAIENQLFFCKQKFLVKIVSDFNWESSDCIFLFDSSNKDVDSVSNIELNYKNLSDFKSKFIDSNDDVRLAYFAQKDLCHCKHLMDYQSMVCVCFSSFITDFGIYCAAELKEQFQEYNYLLEKYSNANGNIRILHKLQDNLIFINEFEKVTNDFRKETSKLCDKISQTSKKVNFDHKCNNAYLKTVDKELNNIKDLTKKFIELKQVNRQQSECEKLKIVYCVYKILTILTDKMTPHFEIFIKNARYWYLTVFLAQVHSLSSLKKLLHCYRCNLKTFENKIQDQSDRNLDLILEKGETFRTEKLNEILNEYKVRNTDITAIIEENVQLVAQMNDLVQNAADDFKQFVFNIDYFDCD